MNQFNHVFFENKVLCHNSHEVVPYLKFPHHTTNRAILEPFQGNDTIMLSNIIHARLTVDDID